MPCPLSRRLTGTQVAEWPVSYSDESGQGDSLGALSLVSSTLCAGPTDQFSLLFASCHFCSLPSSPILCSLSKLKKKSVLKEASGVSLNLGVYVAGGREENAPQGKIER